MIIIACPKWLHFCHFIIFDAISWIEISPRSMIRVFSVCDSLAIKSAPSEDFDQTA